MGQKVLRIMNLNANRKRSREIVKLSIQSVFVGQQVFKTRYPLLFQQIFDVAFDRLLIVGVIQPDIDDGVPQRLESLGKGPHGSKESNDFLNVVLDIICFLPDLHENISDTIIGLFKPGMFFVELIAEDES